MVTQQDIVFLFDVVWPRMEGSAFHRDNCLAQIDDINRLFQAHQGNFDHLLNALDTLSDIGLVVSSGLIFCVNRNTMVPFDKYTMGWALQLRIILDNKISNGNYVDYSTRIVGYINGSNHLKSILDFVREAGENPEPSISPE